MAEQMIVNRVQMSVSDVMKLVSTRQKVRFVGLNRHGRVVIVTVEHIFEKSAVNGFPLHLIDLTAVGEDGKKQGGYACDPHSLSMLVGSIAEGLTVLQVL